MANFLKKVKFSKKWLFCLRATIWVGKRRPILMFCTPLESCGSPLSNGAHWSRVPPRVQSVGGKMWGRVKKGTPKSRSVGKFLFWVGAKNVSVTKKDRRCLLQFSFCQLGHEKWTDFSQQTRLRGVNFENLIFSTIFFHSCKDMLLALKWLGICVKALWHWTIPPFCRVRQESIRKIRARPFLCFFDGEKMHLEMRKSEIFTRVKNIKLLLALCCSEEQYWAVSLTAHPFEVSVWNIGASDAKRGAPGGLKATGWKMPSDPFSAAIFRLGILWKLACS